MVDTTTDSAPQISERELRSRAIYSWLLPAVKLSRRFGVPLKEVGRWLELGYFRELRRSGLTLKAAAGALDVSMRKAAGLSQRLRDNFFQPEIEHELPRRVEFILWAEPASRARIKQLLRNDDPADVDDALERLVAERRVRAVPGRRELLEVTSTRARLVRATWMAQIDGINNLARNAAAATYARVFRGATEPRHERALLRTLNFRMNPEDIGALRELYETVIFPRLAALEERTEGREDTIGIDFSVVWCQADELDGTDTENTP